MFKILGHYFGFKTNEKLTQALKKKCVGCKKRYKCLVVKEFPCPRYFRYKNGFYGCISTKNLKNIFEKFGKKIVASPKKCGKKMVLVNNG